MKFKLGIVKNQNHKNSNHTHTVRHFCNFYSYLLYITQYNTANSLYREFNCNTLCIMGILWDVKPHIQRLTVFFKIAVYYCICRNGLFGAILLRFYFPHFLHLDWHDLPNTLSTTPEQLGTDYTGCVTSLIMIGKSICPSCQKQRECLEYICTSEIYRDITLLSASTVDSNSNNLYTVIGSILSFRVALRRVAPLASEEDTEAEPILPIRRICNLRRAPETPGVPLALKNDFILVSFLNLASGYENMNDHLF